MTGPVFDILCQRFVDHMINCLTGPNALVSFVARHALQELGMASPVTQNLFRSSQHFCRPIATESLLSRRLTSFDLMLEWTSRVPSENVAVATATLELLFAREGHFLLDGFMRCDVGSLFDCNSALQTFTYVPLVRSS
jgi:hypothetical protein